MRKPTRGEAFKAAVTENFALNAGEQLIVDEICDLVDTIDGLPVDDVVERRMQQQILLRAIAALALPEATGGEVVRPTTTRLKAAKAARARWSKEVT